AAADRGEDGGTRGPQGRGAGRLGGRADRETERRRRYRGRGDLMAVLLLADVNDGQLATDSVAKAVDAVKSLGEVHLLVAGPDAAAAEAAKLDGVAKVLKAGDGAYDHGLAESLSALIVSLAGN